MSISQASLKLVGDRICLIFLLLYMNWFVHLWPARAILVDGKEALSSSLSFGWRFIANMYAVCVVCMPCMYVKHMMDFCISYFSTWILCVHVRFISTLFFGCNLTCHRIFNTFLCSVGVTNGNVYVCNGAMYAWTIKKK